MAGGYNYLGRRGEFEHCNYWIRNEDDEDLSVLELKPVPDGDFYASEVTSAEKRKLIIGSGFMFDETLTTLKTNDQIELKEGDIIDYLGEKWFVKSCQQKKITKSRQFMKTPLKVSYIQIKR